MQDYDTAKVDLFTNITNAKKQNPVFRAKRKKSNRVQSWIEDVDGESDFDSDSHSDICTVCNQRSITFPTSSGKNKLNCFCDSLIKELS